MSESKLKTILLGTPEQREARAEEMFAFHEKHPAVWLGRFFFEPGYALKQGIYFPQTESVERESMVGAGLLTEAFKTAGYGMGIYMTAIKIIEQLILK